MTGESVDDAALRMSFDRRTVNLEALQQAAYALSAELSMEIRVQEDENFRCEVFARTAGADPAELAHLVRQEVNDQQLRIVIEQRTGALRDLVFAVAFSRTGVAGEPLSDRRDIS